MKPRQIEDDAAFVDPEYQSFTMQDLEREPAPLLTRIDYLVEMFDLEVQNQSDQPIVITLREKQSHFSDRRRSDVSVVLNNCPTHGAVDKDHRCPEFDGVLRDAWTGDVIPDGPADTQYTP